MSHRTFTVQWGRTGRLGEPQGRSQAQPPLGLCPSGSSQAEALGTGGAEEGSSPLTPLPSHLLHQASSSCDHPLSTLVPGSSAQSLRAGRRGQGATSVPGRPGTSVSHPDLPIWVPLSGPCPRLTYRCSGTGQAEQSLGSGQAGAGSSSKDSVHPTTCQLRQLHPDWGHGRASGGRKSTAGSQATRAAGRPHAAQPWPKQWAQVAPSEEKGQGSGGQD